MLKQDTNIAIKKIYNTFFLLKNMLKNLNSHSALVCSMAKGWSVAQKHYNKIRIPRTSCTGTVKLFTSRFYSSILTSQRR